MNENNTLSKLKQEFKVRNNKKYKIKVISNSIIFDKEVKSQLLSFYYLVLWKDYLKEKST